MISIAAYCKNVLKETSRILFPPKLRAQSSDVSVRVPLPANALETIPQEIRIAVVCHIFHTELCDLIRVIVSNIPHSVDLLVSTDTDQKSVVIKDKFWSWHKGKVDVKLVPNRGRDIAPKLVAFSREYDRYDLILFIHSKKSSHFQHGDRWRDELYWSLSGSSEIVQSILTMFALSHDLGIVISQHFAEIRRWMFWNGNFVRAWLLARRMGFTLPFNSVIDFPAGSMFWARPAALGPLIALHLGSNDFPPEKGQVNGTLHHAIERLFLFVCESAGYRWVKVSTENASIGDTPNVVVASKGELIRFLKSCEWSLFRDGASKSDRERDRM